MVMTDFLNNGQVPNGSAIKSTTSQTVLPDWYTNYAMELLSGQQALSAAPLQTYQGPRVASLTPAQVEAQKQTGVAATAYQPGLATATAGTNAAAAAPGALTAAQPYLGAASGTSVANLGQYMNPYQQQVVDRIAELGNRNLSENIMPGIEGRYIGAGQLGYAPRGGFGTPTGMMTDTARAIRDTQGGISAAQGTALAQGFDTATGLANTDLNRQAQLASTAGGLANTQQQGALSAAAQQATLAGQQQQLGLAGAGALNTVGQQTQQNQQQNLDVAYQDFLKQQGYPQEQINNMLATMKGALSGVPTATTEEGIVPVNPTATTSTGQDIASGLVAGAGLVDALSKILP